MNKKVQINNRTFTLELITINENEFILIDDILIMGAATADLTKFRWTYNPKSIGMPETVVSINTGLPAFMHYYSQREEDRHIYTTLTETLLMACNFIVKEEKREQERQKALAEKAKQKYPNEEIELFWKTLPNDD